MHLKPVSRAEKKVKIIFCYKINDALEKNINIDKKYIVQHANGDATGRSK